VAPQWRAVGVMRGRRSAAHGGARVTLPGPITLR